MHICPHKFFNRCKSNLPSVLHIVVNALCLRTHHNILAIIVKLCHLYQYCSRLYAIYNCVWVNPYLVRLQYIKLQTRKTSFSSRNYCAVIYCDCSSFSTECCFYGKLCAYTSVT
uniref:Uncharacterized protein n=1 Tax=Rhipicephalus microplus TaxID=6941 RepID=A0A6G5AIG0_RHIMP